MTVARPCVTVVLFSRAPLLENKGGGGGGGQSERSLLYCSSLFSAPPAASEGGGRTKPNQTKPNLMHTINTETRHTIFPPLSPFPPLYLKKSNMARVLCKFFLLFNCMEDHRKMRNVQYLIFGSSKSILGGFNHALKRRNIWLWPGPALQFFSMFVRHGASGHT